MKKILVMVCATMMVMASCGTKNGEATEATNDSIAVVEEQTPEAIAEALSQSLEAKDETELTSKIEEIKTFIETKINEGKMDEAQKYIDLLKDFVEEHNADIKAINPAIAEKATELTVSADEMLNKALELVNTTAKDGKEIADEQVNAAKEAIETEVKEKSAEIKDNAKQKANEAIDNATDKLKGKLGI